jgi:hypothetical protein
MQKLKRIQLPGLLFIFICSAGNVWAQVARDSELFMTMQRHDSIFFERGFNLCDTNFLRQVTHKDLVFYHDRSGIQNKAQFLHSTSKYLCSDWNNKPIRKVRKESLEVIRYMIKENCMEWCNQECTIFICGHQTNPMF